MKKNIAAIFDLNGTIIDSEGAHWQAYQEVLKDHGVSFTLEEFSWYWTAKGEKLGDALKRHGRDDLVVKQKIIKDKKNEIFRATIEERLKLMPKTKVMLKRLKGKVKMALDSTSAEKDIRKMLKHFGLEGYFELVTSGSMRWDEKKHGEKSKSNRFQLIADRLEVPNGRCVVVGDAEKDVLAAKAKGMKVISVPNQYTKSNDFSKADIVIKDLGELTLELIGGLW